MIANVAQEKIARLIKNYDELLQKRAISPKQEHFLQDQEQITKDDLLNLSEKMNEKLQTLQTEVRFRYNEEIEGLIVIVKDKDTERVIAEYPRQEAITLMQKTQDLVGILLDKQG